MPHQGHRPASVRKHKNEKGQTAVEFLLLIIMLVSTAYLIFPIIAEQLDQNLFEPLRSGLEDTIRYGNTHDGTYDARRGLASGSGGLSDAADKSSAFSPTRNVPL